MNGVEGRWENEYRFTQEQFDKMFSDFQTILRKHSDKSFSLGMAIGIGVGSLLMTAIILVASWIT